MHLRQYVWIGACKNLTVRLAKVRIAVSLSLCIQVSVPSTQSVR